jgi:hypothetical protein
MAVPVEMPSPLLVRARKFDFMPKQDITPMMGGFLQAVDRSTPLWFAEYTTPELTDDNYDIWVAWLDKLDGAIGTFIAQDPRRAKPKLFPLSNATPWGAAPQVTAASAINSTLTLGSLTNPSTISIGDYIQFQVGNSIYLHRAAELKVTTTTATVEVRPRPLVTSGFPVAARVVRPGFEARVIGRAPPNLTVEKDNTITFTAVQHINRAT